MNHRAFSICLLPLFLFAGGILAAQADLPTPAEKSSPAKPADETWMYFSRGRRTLEGMPIAMENVEITVAGTRIFIPLSAIRGIRLGQGPFDICTIKLMNGDTLNGSIERQEFRVALAWGEVRVDRQKVGYLVRSAFARNIPGLPLSNASQPTPAATSDVVPASIVEPAGDGDYELTPANEALEGDMSWLWENR